MAKLFDILCFVISICIFVYGCVLNVELLVNLGLALFGVVLASFFRCLCDFVEELFQLMKSRNNKKIAKLFRNSFSGIQWRPVSAVIMIDMVACVLAKKYSLGMEDVMEDVVVILGGLGVIPLFSQFLELNAQSDRAYTLAFNYYITYLVDALSKFKRSFPDADGDSKKFILLFWTNYKKEVQLKNLDSQITDRTVGGVDRYEFPLYTLKYHGNEYTHVIRFAEEPLEILQKMCACGDFRAKQLDHQVHLLHKQFFKILTKKEPFEKRCIPILISKPQGLENGGLVEQIMSATLPSSVSPSPHFPPSHPVTIGPDSDEDGPLLRNDEDAGSERNGSFSRTQESRVVNHTVEVNSAERLPRSNASDDEIAPTETHNEADQRQLRNGSRAEESYVGNRTTTLGSVQIGSQISSSKGDQPQLRRRHRPVKTERNENLNFGGYAKEALISAAIAGNIKVVAGLLEKGADVNAKDQNGKTALILSAIHGNDEVVARLLQKGADVNAKDKNGKTALMLSALKGNGKVVANLLEKGADVNAKDKNGKTALILSAIHGNDEVVANLLKKGADVNAKDTRQRTVLHWAAKHGCVGVVEDLLEDQAQVNARDEKGKTALELATDGRHGKVVKLLRTRDKESFTHRE